MQTEEFFGLLAERGIERPVDVRLRNSSQLAGFAKRDDLAYFLRRILGAEYVQEPLLAPNAAMLDRYWNQEASWEEYAEAFENLLRSRAIETALERDLFKVRSVLLCSEPTPERCHRRLVAEYLSRHWDTVSIKHL